MMFQQLKAKTALLQRQMRSSSRQQRRLVLQTELHTLPVDTKKTIYNSQSIVYLGQILPHGKLKDIYTTQIMDHSSPGLYPQTVKERVFFITKNKPMMVYRFSETDDKDAPNETTVKSHTEYITTVMLDMESLRGLAKAAGAEITFLEKQDNEYQILFSTLTEEEQEQLKTVFDLEKPPEILNMQSEKYNIHTFKIFNGPQVQQAMLHSYKKIERSTVNSFFIFIGGLALFCLSTLLIATGYWWSEKHWPN